jgi:hypothetical protein
MTEMTTIKTATPNKTAPMEMSVITETKVRRGRK